MKNNFDNVISLGFFCSVAMEIERMGLRSASYPFDWLICGFEGVIGSIETRFDDFLSFESMAQHRSHPSYYKDIKNDMQFYHDFKGYESLESQLSDVKEKYDRRIKRFYESIADPTLFLRYISSQKEVEWIEKNHNKIIGLLKSFNENNEIIWIANSDIRSDDLHIFFVEKDKDDTVARTFLESNSELKEYLQSLDYKNRDLNLAFYKKSRRKKNLHKAGNKAKEAYEKAFRKMYSHPVKYD